MGGCPVLILLRAIGGIMAKLSAVEVGSVIAPCFTCPTVVILLLVHGALAPEIGVLLVRLGSGGFELQGRLEPRLLLVVAEAGPLDSFLLFLPLRIELALTIIL